MAFQQAPALRLGVGARDRTNGDAQAVGEVAVSGQTVASFELALAQIGRQSLGDGFVSRAGAAGEIRNPYCHGDNI